MTQPNPDQFLSGGGKTLSYDVQKYPRESIFNVWRGGQIIEDPAMVQKRNFDTGKPEFWDDGNPKMQLKLVLQTDEREGEMDDGIRTAFISGQKQKAATQALRDAQKRTGRPDIKGFRRGGKYLERWVGETPPKSGRGYPAKDYEVAYQPPTPEEEAFLAQQAAQAPQAPVAPQQPAGDPFASQAPAQPQQYAAQQHAYAQQPQAPAALQQPAAPAADPFAGGQQPGTGVHQAAQQFAPQPTTYPGGNASMPQAPPAAPTGNPFEAPPAQQQPAAPAVPAAAPPTANPFG